MGLFSLVGLCVGGAAIVGAILGFLEEADAGSSQAGVDGFSKD